MMDKTFIRSVSMKIHDEVMPLIYPRDHGGLKKDVCRSVDGSFVSDIAEE